jgi:endonuclease III related protein
MKKKHEPTGPAGKKACGPIKRKNAIERIYRTLYAFYGPLNWWPGDTPFEVTVGAILTQNTNWLNVEKAIAKLKSEGVLNARALNLMPEKDLALLIRPSGYYNVKAKRLKAFIAFLADSYNCEMTLLNGTDTRALRERLLAINGIGQETCDSILLYALDRPVFVIDAYTKRILSRHNILGLKASYEEFQSLFHDSLERDARRFNEYHALLVSLGKDFCRPVPRCGGCPLNEEWPA